MVVKLILIYKGGKNVKVFTMIYGVKLYTFNVDIEKTAP
jgi:hypothetical protein